MGSELHFRFCTPGARPVARPRRTARALREQVSAAQQAPLWTLSPSTAGRPEALAAFEQEFQAACARIEEANWISRAVLPKERDLSVKLRVRGACFGFH